MEWLAVPLLGGLIGLIWHLRQHDWARHVAFGIGFFLLMGLPTFGLVSMLYMRFSRVADHFVYLPMIGLVGLTVAGLEITFRRAPLFLRPVIPVAITAVLLLYAWDSHTYSARFINQRTLWTYTVAHNPDAWPAQNDLGLDFLNEGNLSEAAIHFRAALRVKPDYAEAHNNLGLVYLREALKAPAPAGRIEAPVPIAPGRPAPPVSPPGGEMAEAATEFRTALQIKPDYTDASGNLAIALQHNQEPGVIGQYKEALQNKPDDVDTRNDLGLALLQAGRMPEAMTQFQQVLQARPGYIDARNNLGLALLRTGHPADAIGQFQQALRIKPDFAEAHNNLGLALVQVGQCGKPSRTTNKPCASNRITRTRKTISISLSNKRCIRPSLPRNPGLLRKAISSVVIAAGDLRPTRTQGFLIVRATPAPFPRLRLGWFDRIGLGCGEDGFLLRVRGLERRDLPEVRLGLRPVGEDFPGHGAFGQLEMAVDHALQLVDFQGVSQALDAAHGAVATLLENLIGIVDVGHAAGHARGKILACGAQHDDAAVGHVLAAVIPDTFHH